MQARPQQIERLCDAWLAAAGSPDPVGLVRGILPAIAELLGASGAGVAFGDGSGFVGVGELGASGSAELADGPDGIEQLRTGQLVRHTRGGGRRKLTLLLRFEGTSPAQSNSEREAGAAAAASAIGRAISRLVPAEERRFGDFEILALLDVGGMAEVHLARRSDPDEPGLLALKRIRSHLSADPGFLELFIREASVAARLDHENVVRILEYGAEGNRPYLAMELLNGASIARLVERAVELGVTLRADLVLALALQWCRGLAAAHAAGVVHCDVSPQNLFVTFDGVGKVLDFGVARAAGVRAGGEVRGKLGYLAPELLSGAAAGPPADVYGLAWTVHDLLRGGPLPDTGETVRRTIRGREGGTELAGPLGEVLRLATAPSTDRRLGTCGELEAALKRAASEAGTTPAGRDEAAAVMRDLFGDHQAAMRRAMAGPVERAGHGTVRVD